MAGVRGAVVHDDANELVQLGARPWRAARARVDSLLRVRREVNLPREGAFGGVFRKLAGRSVEAQPIQVDDERARQHAQRRLQRRWHARAALGAVAIEALGGSVAL